MARRDRTTGLPRPRPRSTAKQRGRFSLSEAQQLRVMWLVLGSLIIGLIAFGAYRWYDGKYRVPNKTVLVVAEEKFALKYYTDRLFLAAQAQGQSGGGGNITILEQTLFTELENEAIAGILAREKGLTVSDEDVTAEIAEQLGVPVGGAGSSFDTLYRQRLRTLRISDDHYRRYTRAQVNYQKLREAYSAEIGTSGDLVTIRKVVSQTKEAADAILARLKAGEDLGTVAQAESADLTSRQKDGLDEPEPPRLLPDAVRTAIGDSPAGDQLFGPVEVSGNFWVFRIQARDPAGAISETQKGQLADLALADAVKAKRLEVKIDNRMGSKDYEWANEHAAD